MRILTITNLYPPHHFGGYEDLCAGAVASWRADGHDVRVLTSEWRRADRHDDTAPSGEPVARALPLAWDDHRMVSWTLPRSLAATRRAVAVVERAVDELRPDVASIWNAGALPFALFPTLARSGVPSVLVVGDTWVEWGVRADPWMRRFRDGPGRLVAGPVARVTGLPTAPTPGPGTIACFGSAYLRRRALARGAWRPVATPVVPMGLALDRFPPTPRPDPAAWRGRLLYVGRLDPRKGVDTALAAVARVPDATLDVVWPGDRATVGGLLARARDLGVADRVRWHAESGPERVLAWYRKADALVFPSRWGEPFGIVPLEAMSQGLPVIATATGGSAEFLVDGVTALRHPPGDVGALAAAVRRLGADADLRRRLAATGLEVATWLDRARTYHDLLEWHGLAAGRRTTTPTPRPMLPPSVAATVGDAPVGDQV